MKRTITTIVLGYEGVEIELVTCGSEELEYSKLRDSGTLVTLAPANWLLLF